MQKENSSKCSQRQQRWLMQEVARLDDSDLRRVPAKPEPVKPKAVIEYERKRKAFRNRVNREYEAMRKKVRGLIADTRQVILFGSEREALKAMDKLRAFHRKQSEVRE